MINRRKVWSAPLDYPVYSPPFHKSGKAPSKKEIQANYDYFLQQKAARLDYLAKYLTRFSIELRLAPETLWALDAWLYRYGGHLLPGGGEVIRVLRYYEPAWTGGYHGLNILSDIGIFAGDYIVSKNKNVRWDVWYGDGAKYDFERPGFGQPCLFGLRHFVYDDPLPILRQVFDCCDAGFYRLRRGGKGVHQEWDIPGEFTRRIEYLSNPNPPMAVPFSHLVIDD
jgi:hypothetical protein